MPATATRAGARHRHPFDLQAYLTDRTAAVDRALDRFLPEATTRPATIHKAMRYSLFAGGKRMRPALCLAAAEACGGLADDCLPLACAVECIHTYSLVHDDLPSMDNDDFRRGRPTCHKVFGDGVAVLAGDALLTIAFEIVSKAKPARRYDIAIFVREIAVAAGSQKLIAGQVADLEAEGDYAALPRVAVEFEIPEGQLTHARDDSVFVGWADQLRAVPEAFGEVRPGLARADQC